MTKMWSSVTLPTSPDHRKRAASLAEEVGQLTALVKAGVRDLSHNGCKSAGVYHYSLSA